MATGRNIVVTVIILLVTITLCIAGVAARQQARSRHAPSTDIALPDQGIAVSVAVARLRTLTLDVTASGFLEPFEELTLSAQVPGYVRRQYIEVSDRVEKDDPLFQLDDALRRIAVDKALAASDRAASELRLAEEQVRRIEKLQAQESANPTEILKVHTDFAVAQAMRKQALSAVEEAQILLEKTTIRAPITGSIARVHTRQGEYARVGQPLVDIIARHRLKLVVQLNDREVVTFAPGDTVAMTTPALPRRRFTGTILRIHPRAAADSRKFEVEIEVPNADLALRPGFYVQAKLHRSTGDGSESVQAITLPRMAVFERYRQQYCYIVRRAEGESVDRAIRTPVETAPLLSDRQFVQVLSGVQPGDRVITTGLQHVTHQSAVRVVEP